MASTEGPNLGMYHSWNFRESGWKEGMDSNLKKLDAVVHLSAIDQQDSPPSDPSDGDRYIVGTGSGDWDGEDNNIAVYNSDDEDWEFFTPKEGWRCYFQAKKGLYIFNGSTWNNKHVLNSVDFESEYDNGSVSSNTDIDWSNGTKQKITLEDDITISFSNMGVGHKQLKVVQDSSGGHSPTLPSGKWPGGSSGSFSSSGAAIDILNIYYDGSDYFYQLTKAWS